MPLWQIFLFLHLGCWVWSLENTSIGLFPTPDTSDSIFFRSMKPVKRWKNIWRSRDGSALCWKTIITHHYFTQRYVDKIFLTDSICCPSFVCGLITSMSIIFWDGNPQLISFDRPWAGIFSHGTPLHLGKFGRKLSDGNTPGNPLHLVLGINSARKFLFLPYYFISAQFLPKK